MDLNDVIQKAVNASIGKAIHNAMQPVLEEMEEHRKKVDLAQAENRALRSHITNAGTDFSISPAPATVVNSPTSTTAAAAATTGMPCSVDTSGCVPDASSVNGVAGSSAGISVTPGGATPKLPCKKNPFTLPGLLKKDLLLIEQGEYIDFDKIKPKHLDQRKREEGEEGFGVAMTTFFDPELGEETLRLKKVSSNRVETFPEWLECWNKFMLARLHYQPDEQPYLMSYQRLITSFAKKYKFSAVYNYDIDFRKILAAERSEAYKSAFWDKQHDELKNEHLSIEQLKAPKNCYKCKEKGHIATNCPKKNDHVSGNKNRSNFSGASNRAPAYPGPPPLPPPPPPMPPMPFPSFHQFQNPYGPAPTYYQPTNVGPPISGNGEEPKKCNTWNHQGRCFRGPTCKFAHLCNKCGEPYHGGINCDKSTATRFAPPLLQPNYGNYRPRF